MEKQVTVLFGCVGRRVSLIEAFRKAAAELKIRARLLGADCSAISPAFHTADKSFKVPPVQDDDYIPALLKICQAEKVDLLIPLTDWELPVVSANKERFSQVGTRAVISEPDTVKICRDKNRTCEFLIEHGFGTPKIYSYAKALEGPFPLFMKPRFGSSAKDIHIVKSATALEFYHQHSSEHVIQEFIRGDEFTVDVFADFSGKARCAVPRQRLEIRAGEVAKGLTVRHPEIIAQSMRLVDELRGCRGVITIQCFLTPNKEIKFIEINPRFGGGAPLAIRAGANFPKWLLQMHLGQEPDISPDCWQDGLLMLRYDAAIFKTLDEVKG